MLFRSVIEQSQPRWLAFLNGQIDLIDPVPPDLANAAAPLGKLAPGLAKKGIRAHRIVAADVTMSYFNMDDPVVGGYTPDKVALRRAIGLGVDLDREIRLVRRGQGIPAQSGVPPNTWGYDPTYKSSNSEYSPSRAKALLDLYGYVDRDGDGWRDQPDGKPLAIEYSTQADQISRQLDELWQKNLNAIGIRVVMRPKQFSENLKAARAGKLMMWSLGSSANTPDGFGGFQRVYGPLSGGANLARFKLDALDELYRRSNELPDGPERLALGLQMNKLVTAYMPYKQHVHRVLLDLSQPWLVGYRRPLFWYAVWMYMDVDMAQRAAAQ